MFTIIYLTYFILLITCIFLIFVSEKLSKLLTLSALVTILIFWCLGFINFDFTSYTLYIKNFVIYKNLGLVLTLGVDSFSLIFIFLCLYIYPLLIIYSYNNIKTNVKFIYIILLILLILLINCFLAFDLFFFYLWFESTLIPMFIIIIGWGANYRKINASYYLVLYTFLLSIPFLICILLVNYYYETTNLIFLTFYAILPKKFQICIGIWFLLAFLVKLPLFPFHLWLPEAHVESTTLGSVILAGIMLKLGYYGLVRFIFSITKEVLIYYNTELLLLGTISCTYSSFITITQSDLKKIIAYSSVSHMSLCFLGLLSNSIFAFMGVFILAVGHTIVSSSLFILIGCFYERYHTRQLQYVSGLSTLTPIFSFITFYFVISNFGFPISFNFLGEFLILIGITKLNFFIVLTLLIYSLLSLFYNIWLYVKTFHGIYFCSNQYNFFYIDMTKLEVCVLLPFILFNFILCFFPNSFINLLITFFYLWLL